MAECLVPPKGSCIIKCSRCKGLYVPESIKVDCGFSKYEECPFCGYTSNSYENTIPVWKYNLLKFFRSGKHVEDIEAHTTEFKSTKKEKEEKAKSTSVDEAIASFQASVNKLGEMIDEYEHPKKKKDYPKKTVLPAENCYELRIRNSLSSWTFYVCGIVDSIGDLPRTGLCQRNNAYYVEAKKQFVVPDGVLWSLDNPINDNLKGGPKTATIKRIKSFFNTGSKTDRWATSIEIRA